MQFTDIFIKRPVLAICVSLLILLFGLAAFSKLALREFPKIDSSVINIQVTYAGASADLMQGFVTTPIENAISGVDGLDFITSSSIQGAANISVHMVLGTNLDTAMTDITSKIASVRQRLPHGIDDPIVDKKDINSFPMMFYAFYSDTLTPEQITDYLTRVVQLELQNLPGVANVEVIGKREYAIRVWLDPVRMRAFNVTATDVKNALALYNLQAPAGTIKADLQQFDVNVNTDLQNPAQFNRIPVIKDANHIVRLGDIGNATLGPRDTSFSSMLNGKPAIFLGVVARPDGNPLQVSKYANQVFNEQILPHLPVGLHAQNMYDAATYIKQSIKEVTKTILEACCFVFLVILLMLGSFRSVLIPVVTIPLSLIGTCIIIYFLGFSVNILTLLAAVLAIGLVVDDGIVVLENIHRHIDEGVSALRAALLGAKEISFAVITMSLTLMIVYIPIGFMGGMVGKLFTEFAFTLASSVIVSGVIALTLSPMMCAKIFKSNAANGRYKVSRFESIITTFFNKMQSGYKKLLICTFKMRYLVVVFAIVAYALCYFLFINTKSELAPYEDVGYLQAVVQAPTNANLQYVENSTDKISQILTKLPEKENVFTLNGMKGVNTAFAILVLKPWNERKASVFDIMFRLMPQLAAIPEVRAVVFPPATLPGFNGQAVEFVLKTTGSYTELNDASSKFITALNAWGGLTNVDSDLKIDKENTFIDVDRNKAADLGVDMGQIADLLGMFLTEPSINHINMGGRSYDVVPKLYARYMATPNMVDNLYVRAGNGSLVPLANIVKIKQQVVPSSLDHFQQLHATKISASLMQNVSQGEAYKYMQNLATKILPKDIQTDTAGQLRQFVETSGKMLWVFIFVLLIIFIVLAMQFESFRDPLIIMLSVPLSFTGAFLAMHIVPFVTLNIYTQIGLITLVGLITKNAILIVEFANQKQKQGLPLQEAIIEAAATRLRPILMTTMAMLLGALPLVLAHGAGANSRAQIGLVIFGGMSIGTLLTLIIIPTMYLLIASRKKNGSGYI